MPISAKAVPHWSSPASSIVRAAARCWGQVSRIRGGTVWALTSNNDRPRAAITPDAGWGLQKFIGRVALATEPTAGIDTLAASHRPHPPWPPWN